MGGTTNKIIILIAFFVFFLISHLDCTKNKKREKYVLVIDVGTYCDYRLIETSVSKLREKYRLVHLTTNKHKMHPDDIQIHYEIPKVLIDKPGEIVTNLTNDMTKKIQFITKNPKMVGSTVSSFIYVSYLLNNVIAKYSPIHLVAHYGNLQHIIASGCFEKIPTTILHFSPGFIPNRSVPFVFNNGVKLRNYNLYDKKFDNFNVESSVNFIKAVSNLMIDKKSLKKIILPNYEFLKKMNHIMCFDNKLVPNIDYIIPNLRIINVGLIIPSIHDVPIERYVRKWINRYTNRIIFISFGSYSKHVLEIFPNLLEMIEYACIQNGLYAFLHDTLGFFTSTRNNNSRLFIYSKYISYNAIVPNCKLVCFTGSICLQNICYRYNCRMLFVPYIPEQYFWAKIYKMHTGVDYVDSYVLNNSKNINLSVFSRMVKDASNTSILLLKETTTHHNYKSLAPSKIAHIVENSVF